MAHTCHATGCHVPVPPDMMMCSQHWFKIPVALRARIWSAYRKGQEYDKRPSRAYCLAAIEAVKAVAAQEGREPDTRLYELMMPEK